MSEQLKKRAEAPLIEGCRLFEKVSPKGRTYLMGRLGGLRVLIFEKRGDDGEHSHVLMIGSAAPTGGDRGR